MKTRRIFVNDSAFAAFIMDAAPEVGAEFFYDHNTVESAEEIHADMDPQTLEAVLPTVYRITTFDSDTGTRWERYVAVPVTGPAYDQDTFENMVSDFLADHADEYEDDPLILDGTPQIYDGDTWVQSAHDSAHSYTLVGDQEGNIRLVP